MVNPVAWRHKGPIDYFLAKWTRISAAAEACRGLELYF